jgi:hypothetical protein
MESRTSQHAAKFLDRPSPLPNNLLGLLAPLTRPIHRGFDLDLLPLLIAFIIAKPLLPLPLPLIAYSQARAI